MRTLTLKVVAITTLAAGLALGAWQVSLHAQTPATSPMKQLPPFKVNAKSMILDTHVNPAHLIYQTNVKFTSTMNSMSITCDRLEANFGSTDNVSAVTATGGVVMSLTALSGGDAANSATSANTTSYQYTGKAGKVVYALEDIDVRGDKSLIQRDRIIRLSKLNPTEDQPTVHVVSTDLKTKQSYQTDLKGDVITYDLTDGVLKAEEVTTESPGSAQ
jgi:hypothetical protein